MSAFEIVLSGVKDLPILLNESSSESHSKPSDSGAFKNARPEVAPQSNILIVEDEMIVAENIKEILENHGFKIAGIVSSGEEAIRLFASENPDLVLMDVRLSGVLDGVQTAEVIHYTMKQAPIIFLTAYAENQFPHLAGLSPQLFIVLSKPCRAKELTEAVEKLLEVSKRS